MATCNSVRQTLASQIDVPITTMHQASETLFLLDSISKHVCNVIDAAELCRCVHSNPKWRDSASNAFAILSDYIGQLNADTNLYRALTSITSSQLFPSLSEEQRRFAVLLKAEFERDGIHLPDSERERVRQLQSHVTQLETLFQENITNSRKLFDVDASWVEQVMPRHIVEAYVPQQSGIPGKITLSSDANIANTLGRYSSNPQLRKEVMMESQTACPENLQVLEALRTARHESATAQGFASYADRALYDKMAKDRATVAVFLKNLQQRIREPYRKDMDMIASAKQHVEGIGSGAVEPWDLSFYTAVLKARNGFDASEVAAYFTIPNCIEGMKLLVKELFGITMKETAMSPEEIWDEPTSRESAVRKFAFSSEDGELGTMYLDLYPREGKYVHAAHFTVLCGCAETVDAKDFQRPVIALVCNLSSDIDNTLVSHSEVETLFHEFGHALHSLLSRTTFQHMSGTRAAMDFVETPSHLMEHFVWDTNFLKRIARHYVTGQVIPDALIAHLQQSRHEFKSLDMQNQILYARFDQALFGPPIKRSSTEIFGSLYRDLGVPHADGTHWHSRFGHLVTYGAGYYGYLYSEAFASDIWQTCFANNSLSRSSGERLWRDLLGHGGAREPQSMLKEVLGREPSEEALFLGLKGVAKLSS